MTTPSWQPGKRVAVVGAGPGGISTGLAFLKREYDVRIFKHQPECQAIEGAMLLFTQY
jgi:2-polyprenyl-6-methoxyphenol hydroxylase-like FAD-dependent oxidoreductase